jgi:hypothetical protein
VSSLTNLLEDGADVAAHMLVPSAANERVLSALIVHVEQIGAKVGHLVEGELPKLEKGLLGFAPPEPTAEQKLIAELQSKVDALSTAGAASAAGSGAEPTAEDQRIAELETQERNAEAQAKQRRISELEAKLAEQEAALKVQAPPPPDAGAGAVEGKPVE